MRRAIIYLFHDSDGIVDDYVLVKLRALREHAQHIHVVCNGRLTPSGSERLGEVADTVQLRKNVGFDVAAYKSALEEFGADRLTDFDELILMNYTFFGPIYPFGETFDRMDAQPDLDFWGLTEHKTGVDHGLGDADGRIPAHLQSHWLAVRTRMFSSPEFRRYWRTMPKIDSYVDSIRNHETRFTSHFDTLGFTWTAAFPAADYPDPNSAFVDAALLLEDRCPILKRRIFTHDPSYIDREAILGGRLIEKVATTDYPTELLWRNLLRTAQPRILYTNTSLFSVLPDAPEAEPTEPAPRICVLAHVYYPEMTDEIMASLSNIPVPFDVVVTTATAESAQLISERLAEHRTSGVDVRVVESNSGRSESAFLITCRDVLTSGRYDLILKVHAKKSPQDGYNRGATFKQHTIDNLLSSPAYVGRILELFHTDPLLGMVIPPLVHLGFPTMGHSWFSNREPARSLADRLGIRTVFDDSTPLAANGGMFWARPQALAKLAEYPFTFDDFVPGDAGWKDGQLPHVLERLYSYTAIDAGYKVRAAANSEWVAIDYPYLEFKLQRVAALLPGYTDEQVERIRQLDAAEQALGHANELLQAANLSMPRLRAIKRYVERQVRAYRRR